MPFIFLEDLPTPAILQFSLQFQCTYAHLYCWLSNVNMHDRLISIKIYFGIHLLHVPPSRNYVLFSQCLVVFLVVKLAIFKCFVVFMREVCVIDLFDHLHSSYALVSSVTFSLYKGPDIGLVSHMRIFMDRHKQLL